MMPSAFASTMVPRDVRFIFCDFEPRQWRLNAAPAFTLPVPVTLNRFLAALLVFILGILRPFLALDVYDAGAKACPKSLILLAFLARWPVVGASPKPINPSGVP